MIEIAPKEYWQIMNWYDGLLYLSLLEIDGHTDWRYPTSYESPEKSKIAWYQEDVNCSDDILTTKNEYYVIPVREV